VRSVLLFLVLIVTPVSALAQEANVTRREGFLLLWSTIQRRAYETWQAPYTDVPEGAEGHLEITWAKRRGILDDEQMFHPDDLMTINDALLWLFRTRNVDDLDEMKPEHLETLLQRYPVEVSGFNGSELVTREKLNGYIEKLNTIFDQTVHEVSLYAEKFHGKGTAFGETFDMHALTAAHPTFPHNTLVRVTNIENGESVIVRVNDRGPFVEGRSMDLSLAAFTSIAERSSGVISAKIERLGDAELIGCADEQGDRYDRAVHFQRDIERTFMMNDALNLQANRWFVMRGIRYPDGTFVKMQDWVSPEDTYTFLPSVAGTYHLRIAWKNGRTIQVPVTVEDCAEVPVS